MEQQRTKVVVGWAVWDYIGYTQGDWVCTKIEEIDGLKWSTFEDKRNPTGPVKNQWGEVSL